MGVTSSGGVGMAGGQVGVFGGWVFLGWFGVGWFGGLGWSGVLKHVPSNISEKVIVLRRLDNIQPAALVCNRAQAYLPVLSLLNAAIVQN